MRRLRDLPAVLVLAACAACGSSQADGDADGDMEAEARAVPVAQSAAARAFRLPRVRPASVAPGAGGKVIRVQVVVERALPPDTTVQVRSFDPACGESFVDTAVFRNGASIIGALVWVEGSTPVHAATPAADRRPTVMLEQCRLQPRLQLAAPGSTMQLATRDARAEALVVVPSSASVPIDTVSFTMDGQLVPVQHRADSSGVLAIYATRLPWARAYIAILPAGVGGITAADGTASFQFAAGGKAVIRAWHPSLGVAATTINPGALPANAMVTLTYRR